MKLGFGLITCQRYPGDPRSDRDLYREAIELSVEAERLGFDSVWTSEHHFLDDAYMPAVLPLSAAIAARTERVEIGTGVLLVPLYDPLRLAEDAATVDLIADGRFILGIGLGWRAEEFEALGIPTRDRRRRLEGTIAVLRQAWSDGLVTGTEAMPYPGVAVTPKPARRGGPPLWIGGFAEPAVRRAGRAADGFMGSGSSPERFARQVGWVREELERAGRDPDDFAFSLHVRTFAWHGEDAWERVRPYMHYGTWKYDDMEEARGRTGPPAAPPPLSAPEEEALRRQMILGTPEEVAERILAFREAAGAEVHFIARMYWTGMEPALQREAMRIFCEEVAPLVRAERGPR